LIVFRRMNKMVKYSRVGGKKPRRESSADGLAPVGGRFAFDPFYTVCYALEVMENES